MTFLGLFLVRAPDIGARQCQTLARRYANMGTRNRDGLYEKRGAAPSDDRIDGPYIMQPR